MSLFAKKRGFLGKKAEGGLVMRHLMQLIFAVMIVVLFFLVTTGYGDFSAHEKEYFSKDIAYSIDAISVLDDNILIDYPNGLDRYNYMIHNSKVTVYDKNPILGDDAKVQYFINGSSRVYLSDIGEKNYFSNYDAHGGIFIGDVENFVLGEGKCDSDYILKEAGNVVFYLDNSIEQFADIILGFDKVFDTYVNRNLFNEVREVSSDASINQFEADLFLGIRARYDSNYFTVIYYNYDSAYSKAIACNIANGLHESPVFNNTIIIGKDMKYLTKRDGEQIFIEFRIKDEDSGINRFQSDINTLVLLIAEKINVVYNHDE